MDIRDLATLTSQDAGRNPRTVGKWVSLLDSRVDHLKAGKTNKLTGIKILTIMEHLKTYRCWVDGSPQRWMRGQVLRKITAVSADVWRGKATNMEKVKCPGGIWRKGTR